MSLVYSAIAWGMVLVGLVSIVDFVRKGTLTVQRLHKIPCSNCQYFSCNYVLKCTVHPSTALTESAIDCRDYTSLEG
jgi:uncharacterized membrane protein YhaH (DUF805 family)